MTDDEERLSDFADASMWRFTRWVQTGKERWQKLSEPFWRVPAEVKDTRYGICQNCDQFNQTTTQCQQCLCFMGIKTWLGGFACPLDKWQALEPKESESID